MTNDVAALVRLNVEMEGLLRVLDEREHPEALEALVRKAREYEAKVEAFADDRRATPLKEAEAVAPEMEDSFEAVAEEVAAEDPTAVIDESTDNKDNNAQPCATRPRMELAKAFSLNDRFRYTSELFEGNTRAFHEALDAMGAMPDFAAALEYMRGTLGLDLTDAVAKEFADRVAANMPG